MSRKLETYGIPIPQQILKQSNQLTIDLIAYRMGGTEKFGGFSKSEHAHKIIENVWPWVWKNWHDWSEMCLWAWCNYEEIGMTGCSSAHKTFTFSLLATLEWLASPGNTTIRLTSTTVTGVKTRLFFEVKRFYTTAQYNGKPLKWPYNVVDSDSLIQVAKGDLKNSIMALAVDRGSIEKAVGNIQGNHAPRVILMVDEAAQTQPAVFKARQNLKVGTDFYRFVAIANASSQFDEHGKFCEPKDGWSTITPDDEKWETKGGICVHFDGRKSPNVKLGYVRYPYLYDNKALESHTQLGVGTMEYWMWCVGFWPPSGTRNTVVDAAMIFTGQAKNKAEWREDFIYWAALDPAFTSGGDRCILRIAKVGKFTDGELGMELIPPIQIKFIESSTMPVNYQIADKVRDECNDRQIKPKDFSMDVTSASGLFDIIGQRFGNGINGVNFGGSAPDVPVSRSDRRSCKTVYSNKVAYIWFCARRMIENGRLRGLDDDTAKELTMRQYKINGEKYVIETKSEMKLRSNGVSPDIADATALLCQKFIEEFGMNGFTEKGNQTGMSEERRFHRHYNELTFEDENSAFTHDPMEI